jgi:2-phosphosulfolactate phosphatase
MDRVKTVEAIERGFDLTVFESPSQLTVRRSFILGEGLAVLGAGCQSIVEQPVCVVVDAIRNSTCIASLFALGAEQVVLFSKENLANLERATGRYKNSNLLLAGENEGGPLPGFHFGNSPLEFCSRPHQIVGATVLFASTNGGAGVGAIQKANPNSTMLLATLFNIESVAEILSRLGAHVVFLCGGFRDASSLEDSFAVGAIIHLLQRRSPKNLRMDSSAFMAANIVEPYLDCHGRVSQKGRERMLETIRNYSRVAEVLKFFGHEQDVRACVTGDGLPPHVVQILEQTVPFSNQCVDGGTLFLPHYKVPLPIGAGIAAPLTQCPHERSSTHG